MYKIHISFDYGEVGMFSKQNHVNKKSDREQPLPENKPNKLFMKNPQTC